MYIIKTSQDHCWFIYQGEDEIPIFEGEGDIETALIVARLYDIFDFVITENSEAA